MLGIAPISSVRKYGFQLGPVVAVADASPAMIKMQVGQEHVRYITRGESFLFQGTFQCVITMQIIMREKFCVLLVTDPVINKDEPITIFYQQATQGPRTKVVLISRVGFIPEGFWNYPEHRSPVKFKKTGIDNM